MQPVLCHWTATNGRPPLLTIIYIYCTGGIEMPQLHIWQPLSICHQNPLRNWPENSLHREERTNPPYVILPAVFKSCCLERLSSYKYLGAWRTSTQNWSTHISEVCTRAKKQIGIVSFTVMPPARPYYSSIQHLLRLITHSNAHQLFRLMQQRILNYYFV